MTSVDLYDAPSFYDVQYRHYRDDVAFYRGVALDVGGPTLELGAGTGRITVELARVASPVVALEPSAGMRAACAARLAEAAAPTAPSWDVTIVDGDARTFDGDGRFELVVSPFHVLNQMLTTADQDAFLASAYRSVRPGGTFALDVLAPSLGTMDVLRRDPTWNGTEGNADDVWWWQTHHPARQCIETVYLRDVTREDGTVVRTRVTNRQRYLHRFELERAVRQAGFRDVRVFGDFDRRPVDDAPARFVVMARA